MNIDATIAEAFGALDREAERSAGARVLRERLAGELVGDVDRVAATLTPDFELILHAGGPAVTVAREAVLGSVRHQGSTGALMWTEIEALVEADETLAGHGSLHTLSRGDRSLTTVPMAFFIHYTGDRMSREVAFMDFAAATTVGVDEGDLVSVDRVREIVG